MTQICGFHSPVQSDGVEGEGYTYFAARMHELDRAQPPGSSHDKNHHKFRQGFKYKWAASPFQGRMLASNHQGSGLSLSELSWQVARVLTCRVQTRRVNTVVPPFSVRGAGRGLPQQATRSSSTRTIGRVLSSVSTSWQRGQQAAQRPCMCCRDSHKSFVHVAARFSRIPRFIGCR